MSRLLVWGRAQFVSYGDAEWEPQEALAFADRVLKIAEEEKARKAAEPQTKEPA